MKFSVKVEGMNATVAYVLGHGKQVVFASAKALTQTAHAVNGDLKTEMQKSMAGGATAYTLRAFKVTGARKDKLEAVVELRRDSPGKGSIWERAIGHLFTGGSRDTKRMERAFSGAGILPFSYVMVPASNSWAMPLDGNGNAPRGLIVQLIAYFKAFGEQGYKANMTDKRRAKLANVGRTGAGYRAINGVVYFVSQGKGRGQHLPAGIWAKRGTHGSDIAPVFLFVRPGRYGKMFDLEAIARKTINRVWQPNFDAALTAALASARP